MVPFPRHNVSRKQWISNGRIIVYSLKRLQYMPLFISRCFFVYTLFGEENLNQEIKVDGFLQFVSSEEKDILRKAKDDYQSVDEDELLDVLGAYKYFTKPSSKNITIIISKMAHLHLIQAPKYLYCFPISVLKIQVVSFTK